MPNKEKSVKIVPNTNGNVGTMNDAIKIEPTSDVIATDVKKAPNNKKKDKHKNKDAAKTNNNNATKTQTSSEIVNSSENGMDATLTNDDDEIRAVGEELLKRLQCNGTSISVCRSNESVDKSPPKQIDNGLNAVTSDQSKPQPKSKQINNNNNSKAHNKNCQNQHKSAKNVNSSSNNTDINSDGMQIIQCNGTHIVPTVDSSDICMTDTRLSSADMSAYTDKIPTASEQSESAATPKESTAEIPSCSNQYYDNQPSTSVSITNEFQSSSLPKSALSVKSIKTDTVEVTFKEYENELQMPDIMRVIQRELSEPYSIYTYRYFIHNWPKLCFLAMDGGNCIGAIVCKLDIHRQMTKRGYIAMLAVDAAYRKLKVGTTLVQKAIEVSYTFFSSEYK